MKIIKVKVREKDLGRLIILLEKHGFQEELNQKGDIIWVDFPFTDGTKTKVRPALVKLPPYKRMTAYQ